MKQQLFSFALLILFFTITTEAQVSVIPTDNVEAKIEEIIKQLYHNI